MNPHSFNLDQWVNHLSKQELTIELKKRGLIAAAVSRNRLINNYDIPILPDYDTELNDELIYDPNHDPLYEQPDHHQESQVIDPNI